ncbi:MAG: PAS domain S-box protein [Rhodoferax sp.]|uniref:PAS domain S-box protein n=1 Tax=Rhodoferax sp. TaxID=50421 RepID=UPI001B712190|nr:PAS domain S-box protein [Rhodoferax sp.]MBP9904159.1 PAS domain S-box protein [Rhodoferax sp.]
MAPKDHLIEDPIAQRIVTVGSALLCFAGFALAVALLGDHSLTSPRVFLHIFLGAGGALGLWFAIHQEFRKAAFLLIGTYWIGVACVTVINGGLRGPNLVNFPLILVISSWVLGVRPTISLAILSEIFLVGLLIVDDFGFKTEADYSNKLAYFIFLTAVISMTALASVLARNGYLKKVKEYQEIVSELADSEIQLKQNLAQLESLVKIRTTELALAKDNLWAMNEAQLIGRVGTYVTDIKTGHWQGSEVLDDIFGIDATFERTIPNWNGLIAPEFRQELLDYYYEVIATQGNFHKEYQVVRPVDGRTCWVEALGEFSFDDLGKPAFLRGTILDISDRKAAQLELQTYQNHLEELVQQKTLEIQQQQELLRDQELRFTLAVEGADEGIWDLNLITQELYHSPRMTTMLGYTPDELPPAREVWQTLTHPDDYPQYHQKLLAHIEDADVPFETVIRLRHKDGTWRWILSRGRATRNVSGHAIRISGTNSDITERMRVEELLRISEEKHRILLDESSDPIFSFERGGRYTYVNSAFAIGVGKTQTEIVGRTLWDVFPKEDADRRHHFLQSIFQDGKEANLNVRLPSPTGDRFLITTAKPIFNADRQVISVICVSKDVTSIVEAEEAARAANLTKSEFLANMSHEIRTPMNGVIGMVDILQQTALTSEQQRMLSTIANSSQTLLEILNDILDYSKIEAGKLSVEHIPTPLKEVAESVLQLMHGTANAKDIALQLTLAPGLPMAIYADPTRLRQVLLNLIGNAIKFTHAEVDSTAQVTLTLETGRLADGHAAVLLHVRDCGIGMSAEVVAKLFVPFTQADASTARQFGGTGLGLSITDRLVRLMGGQITVKSTLGEGTEFTVALPLQEAPLTAVVSQPADSRLRLRGNAPTFDEAAASGQLILLAEDNETNRDVLREQLRLLGYCADTAEDGQVALEKWRSGLYALLLTDCHMPHMDGFALARAIRTEEIRGSRLPIIAITANAMQGEDQRCLQAGMDDYLSKPLRLHELAPMLEKWLPLPSRPEEPQIDPELSAQSITGDVAAIEAESTFESWNCNTLSQMVGDNREMHERLLKKFLANAERQVPGICEALSVCEFKKAVALAHTLKSAARSVGALALGELCQHIETAGNAGDSPACATLAADLPVTFAVAMQAIREHLAP